MVVTKLMAVTEYTIRSNIYFIDHPLHWWQHRMFPSVQLYCTWMGDHQSLTSVRVTLPNGYKI